jgi:cobalt-zinc-cadmium efflux system outer membrane protein
VLCLSALAAQCARADEIEELVQRALSRNRDYLAEAERVREAEALLRRAGFRPAPALEVQGGSTALLGAPGSQDYSIAYLQPLETGGKRGRRLEFARLGLELAKAQAEEKRRQLAFEVRRHYADALNARGRSAVLAETGRLNSEVLRIVAARVEQGDAAPLERQLLETELTRAEVDRLAADARLETAILDLIRIGALDRGAREPDSPPPASFAAASESTLVQRALQQRSDLRVLRQSEEQARSGVVLAQAESSPNIGASARYSYRSTTLDQFGFDGSGSLTPIRDRESVLSFGISVPLFTARNNRPNVDASVAREREARLRREYLLQSIPSEVAAAFRKWAAARRALEIFDGKILRQSRQTLDIMRQAWQLGQLRLLDILNEQRRVLDLQLARVDAETELVNAWAGLEFAVGGDIR